jgi:hypothetical protein
MRRCLLALGLFGFGLSGCSAARTVHVVDQSGVPVQGAEVEVVSLSINSGPSITDAAGNAEVPSNPQATRWVVVSKAGFVQDWITVPSQWPLHIMLSKSSTTSPAVIP